MKSFTAKNRILISRLFALLVFVYIFVSDLGTIEDEFFHIPLSLFGFILVLIGSIGRLWCALYIEGNKTKKLRIQGPYSISRNPLYFFSFIMLSGYMLGIQNIVLPFILCLFFVVVYYQTIKNEEINLTKIHGKKYIDYCNKVPMIFPRFKNYNSKVENETIEVKIKNIQNVLIETAGFILMYFLVFLFV
ncbi:MAG: hypothetical protein CMG00_01310 [Candidatus Marinimicrobia bacterium]|nr:hypothetical protein [Candidatus Neomarinimicrobiota bacterium]|tara:strand:- start:1337 stop:1906 length:570 start_codon:yes stop_codon:yes gene_type:complete